MENRVFNQRQVNQIFRHVHVNTLRWWLLQGLYSCVNAFKDKRGVSRQYGVSNLYQIAIVENLSSLDVRLDVIKRIINELNTIPPMEKFIIITKHPVQSKEIGPIVDKLRKTTMFAWHHMIIEPEQFDTALHNFRDDYKIAIIIVIDLASIKAFVDYLIREF